MAGLEHSFVESWEGWDIVGSSGDLAFYNAKVKPEFEHLVPGNTTEVMFTLLMSESVIQFDFFNERNHLGYRAFKITAQIEEEIPYDE